MQSLENLYNLAIDIVDTGELLRDEIRKTMDGVEEQKYCVKDALDVVKTLSEFLDQFNFEEEDLEERCLLLATLEELLSDV